MTVENLSVPLVSLLLLSKEMNYLISRSDLRNCVHDDRTAFDCLISQGYIQLAEHLELNSLALEIDILKCRCAQLIVWKRITYQQCLLPRFFFISMRKIF